MGLKFDKIKEENEKDNKRLIDELEKELETAEDIEVKGNKVGIKTKNRTVELNGKPTEIEMNVNRCMFCGHVGTSQHPLFSMDGKSFICKPCLIMGFRTMLLNHVSMPTVEEMSTDEKFDAYQY